MAISIVATLKEQLQFTCQVKEMLNLFLIFLTSDMSWKLSNLQKTLIIVHLPQNVYINIS